jgi:hypothetical protein
MKRFLKNKVNLQHEAHDSPGVFVIELYSDARHCWIDSIWSTMELAEDRKEKLSKSNYFGGSVSKYPLDTVVLYNDDGIN